MVASARAGKRKVNALTRKTQPAPTQAMTRPAAAGPSRRAALKEAEFRPTALERSPAGTIRATKI
jgi:hypothetical protein